jgi:hypothetical protein
MTEAIKETIELDGKIVPRIEQVPNEEDPEEPTYKRLDALTSEELNWNVARLRKEAEQFCIEAVKSLRHADALQAYRDQKFENPSKGETP